MVAEVRLFDADIPWICDVHQVQTGQSKDWSLIQCTLCMFACFVGHGLHGQLEDSSPKLGSSKLCTCHT